MTRVKFPSGKHMAEFAPFAPRRAPGNPTYACVFAALQGRKPPLVLRCRHLGFLIPGIPGPRDCSADRTGIWCSFSAGCSQSNGQISGSAGPSDVGVVPVQAPGPGAGRFQQRAVCGRSTGLGRGAASAVLGWHTRNQHLIYIDVACYVPMCIYESM